MRLRGVLFAVLAACLALATPAAAQQTGALSGKVVDTGGAVLPGVTVEARSDVLPGPRVIVTDGNDNTSNINLEDLMRKAQQSDVLIYSIGILSEEEPREAKFDDSAELIVVHARL